jgi:thiol-disulfide isomerase/thioredoxin
MRFCFLAFFLFSFITLPQAQADSFDDLSDHIKNYRKITNTPIAPDLPFQAKDGSLVQLSDYRGKVIVLNLWATWCPPCIKEMPNLNNLATFFKNEDLVVIALASGRQGREEPDAFLEKRNLTQMISLKDRTQAFLDKMKMNALPVTFVIDQQGRMRGGIVGISEWDSPEIIHALSQTLKP